LLRIRGSSVNGLECSSAKTAGQLLLANTTRIGYAVARAPHSGAHDSPGGFARKSRSRLEVVKITYAQARKLARHVGRSDIHSGTCVLGSLDLPELAGARQKSPAREYEYALSARRRHDARWRLPSRSRKRKAALYPLAYLSDGTWSVVTAESSTASRCRTSSKP
jgi:hypothetical protein